MADNKDIVYGVGANTEEVTRKLQALKADITAVTSNLDQAQGTMQRAVTRMTADIQKSIDKAKAGSDQLLASMRRLNRVGENTIKSEASGTFVNGQVTRAAAGQRVINDVRNTAAAVEARVTDAIIQQFTQKMRTMDRVVDARMRQAIASADRIVADAAPEAMGARRELSDRARQNSIKRAEMGDARYGMANTLERISSNGGADIITVQAKLIAGYAALNLAMSAISNTAQFIVGLDSEFRQFQAITATTNFEMIGLKENLIGVSEASKFTALEIAQAATVMGQAGLSAREVGETVGSVAELATAAGSTLAESVDVVTSTMAIFNLQTSQAADVANTLTSALNLSKLSMDKLTLGFQYAGNTAAQMGVTYQELTGVLGALANSGIRSGSTLGTGLRQLLIDIQDPSKKLQATLKELGLTEEDINVESNGLINVLETLKDSGFGAAQAFESFEVRAAAAYVALANNTDLAVELQQQFILSAAAAEANAVQMESLSNTFAKFQSVVGTVAYNAFEPLIAALQDFLNGIADAIAVLNKIPGVLQIVSVAFASLATTIGLLSLSALTRGLLGALLPMAQLGTAATGAAAGVGLLNAAMKINPIFLGASLLAGAVTAFYAFGGGVDHAAERLDALKAQVNIFGGEIDTASGQIEAINQTISNLIRQKQALDADPLMNTSKILEVKQAFTEISSEVDTTTGSVEDLIAALNNLASGDYSKIGTAIGETISANDALIAEYRSQLAVTQAQAPTGSLFETGSTVLQYTDPAGYFGTNGDISKQQDMVSDLVGKLLGDQFAQYADMIFDPTTFPTDPSAGTEIAAKVRTEFNNKTARRDILKARERDGNPLTQAEMDELKLIPVYLELLTALKTQIEPLATANLNIANTESQNKILKSQQIQNAASDMLNAKGVTARIQSLESEYQDKYIAIRADSQDMSAEELMIAYKELDATFKVKIEELTADAQAITDQLIANNAYVEPNEIRGAVDAATINLTGLAARISTEKDNSNIAFQKVQEEFFKTQLEEVDDAIKLQLNGRTRAITIATIDQIEEYVKEQFDRKRQITAEIFAAKIGQETDDDQILQLQEDLRQSQREINTQEKETLLGLADDKNEIRVQLLDDEKKAVDEQVKLMEGKLNELLVQISKASPGPVMDALIAQWQKIALAQQGLIDESNTLGIESGVLSTGAIPLPEGSAMKANDAVQFMMGLGYTKAQASGIVGNLMAESNMDSTNNTGDGGKAFGLAQWHPDRQALLRQFAGTGQMNPTNPETQLRFIDWEMKNSPSTALDTYDQLMQQNTPAGAADVFRRRYERPNEDLDHSNRIGFANTLAAQDYGVQQANTTAQVTGLADSVQTGTTNAITAQSAAAVKTSMQQVQTLMTQAGIATNPDTIKGMMDSVDQLYNGIVEEKLKSFDAENADKMAVSDPSTLAERDSLIEGLKADQNQKMSTLLEGYWQALDEKIQEPLEDAQRMLAEAQKPENAGKFTGADILNLENNVRIAERKVLVDQLSAAQQVLAESQARLAETEPGSSENNYWLLEEARALEVVNGLTREKNAADAVTVQQGSSVASAIDSATKAWAMQNGILDEAGQMVPLAKQVEGAWGGVLDTLTSGFSTLFTDLAKGTMTAEEAFKKFALSVIDSFIQMIAKALAMQLVMGMFGGGGGATGGATGGGGDFFSQLIGGLFGTPAMANGGRIPGSANGEIIPGISNRDSVLRSVMPGEMILRRSAVSAIGEGALENLNNLGSRTISEAPMGQLPANDNPGGSGTVNVYVVAPDQIPPLSEKDVVAYIAGDIQKRGTIKQLIKSVSIGAI